MKISENEAVGHMAAAVGKAHRIAVPLVRALLRFFKAQGLNPRRIYARAGKGRDPTWKPLPPYPYVSPDSGPATVPERSASSMPPTGAANRHHQLRR